MVAAFLDDQRLSPFGDCIQMFLANTPLGYDSTPRIERTCSGDNIPGGGGSHGAGSSGPVLHMLIATVVLSLREHPSVPASVHTAPVSVFLIPRTSILLSFFTSVLR